MAKLKKAYNDLAEVLGSPPPAEFNNLSAADLATLSRLVAESVELHEAALAEAEDVVVNNAPRPMRGTIRKILGA